MGKTYRNSAARARVTISRSDRIRAQKADRALSKMRHGRIDYSIFDDDDEMDALEDDSIGFWTSEND